MASAAQFEANRLNAAASCGPKTPDGKARSSRNHLKFGLFSTQNCIRPEEAAEYTKLSKALWKDLNPVGPVEEMLAVEIVRVAWRLRRCVIAEAEDGENPATQAAVDRARASAHNSLRRVLNDLRQFQSDRWLRAEVLRDGFDEAYYGIADSHRVKGLADDNRLKSQTIQTQLFGQVGQAVSPANVGQASSPVKSPGPTPEPLQSPASNPRSLTPDAAIPRNAPCPCHSGLKYKRCCGTAAPPVLGPGLVRQA